MLALAQKSWARTKAAGSIPGPGDRLVILVKASLADAYQARISTPRMDR